MAIFLGILAVVLNQFFCLLLLRIEKWAAERGEIPQRGEILYLNDYNFFKYGDRIFLGVMDLAITYVLVERWLGPPWWGWIICAGAVLVWTALWHWIWLLPSHNPDSLYSRPGVVNSPGKVHLPYFGLQYFWGFVGLAMIALMALGHREWSHVAWVGLGAAGLYFVTFFSDFFAGRFTRKR